jgi:hypothetical protein
MNPKRREKGRRRGRKRERVKALKREFFMGAKLEKVSVNP